MNEHRLFQTFQCTYCHFETKVDEDLQEHISLSHREIIMLQTVSAQVDRLVSRLNNFEALENRLSATLKDIRDSQTEMKQELFLIRNSQAELKAHTNKILSSLPE